MNYHFKNLVFEGGGVKGIAYAGAMKALEERDILQRVRRVGGTSAGAINALLTGLGCTPDEVMEILWDLDFNKFLDDSWGIIRDAERLISRYGWYKGEFFKKWIAGIISDKTGSPETTFFDIETKAKSRGFKSMFFIGTNLSTGFAEIYSAETAPQLPVADAVRISMSIPLFFTAVRNSRNDVLVDGGMLNNYPVKLFDRLRYIESGNYTETDYYFKDNSLLPDDRGPGTEYVFNRETLGFRLDTKEEISVFRDGQEPVHRDIDGFFDFTGALINTVIEAQQNSHLHSDDWARTIYIDTLGVKTTDFGISGSKKEALVESGRLGAESYFRWYDSDPSAPNRP